MLNLMNPVKWSEWVALTIVALILCQQDIFHMHIYANLDLC